MKTFTTISLGCKVNAYEISALSARLKENGYVEDENNPDVAIINTCSVTATADQKSRQHIRKLLNNYPNAIVVVMGCYSQGQHDFIKNEIKADIITGTSNRDKIVEVINSFKKGDAPIDLTDKNPRIYEYEELGLTTHFENVRAYLKIQDGCDNFCSYCLIPYRRGKARNRDKESVLNEATSIVEQGYKEIVLTGIHVGGYGKGTDYSFSSLVEDLLNIKGLYRLRISSIEESEIDEKLIELINSRDNLATHFHIPLQSGSDTILKRMNRKYNCEQFLSKIEKIKKACPQVTLTTDVIVGFPGESEEEFQETFNFIQKCGFHQLHVFPFSAREGTLAFKMKDQIDSHIKKQRVLCLIELSNRLWNQYTNKFVNQEVEVLVEQYDEKEKYNIGHTSNFLEVKIKFDSSKVGETIKTVLKNKI